MRSPACNLLRGRNEQEEKPMIDRRLFVSLTAALGALLGLCGPATAAADDPCAGDSHCFNAGTFIAQIVQVSPSAMGNGARNHTVTFNVRFRNISDKPIILAYRVGSSAGMDDFGNAYAYGRPNHDASAQGIGMVDGRNADPQFTLTPGQARNAMFAMIRFNARAPVGTAFSYHLVIEELGVIADATHSLHTLRQNSLSFSNLTAGTMAAATSADLPATNPATGGATSQDPLHVAGQVIDLFKKATKK